MSDYTRYEFFIQEDDPEAIHGFPSSVLASTEVKFRSDTRWHSVLYAFAKFLGAHYGYDITDKIEIDGKKLHAAVTDDTFAVERFKREWEESQAPSMKPKKKKKNKKLENFFMGSAADWEDVE